VDSGQALAQWYIEPYTGSFETNLPQILWGYEGAEPISPVGYKWSTPIQKVINRENILSSLIEQRASAAEAFKAQTFDGIVVYNPITPGFSGFTPGTDTGYFANALSDAEAEASGAISQAVSEASSAIAAKYDFVRG
jgi:hypothetical protein